MAQLFSEMFDQPKTSPGQLHPDLDALIRKPFDEKFIRAIMSPDIRVWNKYALGDEKPTLGEVLFPWTRSERFYQAEQMRNMFQQHATSLMMTGGIAGGVPPGSITPSQPGTPGTLANPNELLSLVPPGIPQGSGIQGPGPGIPINPGTPPQPTMFGGRPIDPGQEALLRRTIAPSTAWLQAGIPPPERMIGIPEQQAALGFEQGMPSGPVTESTVRGAISGFGATQRETMREASRKDIETQRETARAHEKEMYSLTRQEQLEKNRIARVQREQIESDRQERLTRQAFNSDRRSLAANVGLSPFLLQDAQGNMMGINPAAYQTHATNIEQYVQKAQQRADQSRRSGKGALADLWQQEADLYKRAVSTMPDPETPAGKYNLYRQQGMSKEDAAKKAGVVLKK